MHVGQPVLEVALEVVVVDAGIAIGVDAVPSEGHGVVGIEEAPAGLGLGGDGGKGGCEGVVVAHVSI